MPGGCGGADDCTVPEVIQGLRVLLEAIDDGVRSCSAALARLARLICWPTRGTVPRGFRSA
jgi:hypothetical protein